MMMSVLTKVSLQLSNTTYRHKQPPLIQTHLHSSMAADQKDSSQPLLIPSSVPSAEGSSDPPSSPISPALDDHWTAEIVGTVQRRDQGDPSKTHMVGIVIGNV